MPKKSKRQARKTPAAIAPVAAAPVPVQTAAPARLATAAEFNPDYTNCVQRLAPHRHPGGFLHRCSGRPFLFHINIPPHLKGGRLPIPST